MINDKAKNNQTQSINFTKNKQPNSLKDFNKIILFLPNNKCTNQRPTKK